eukprot:Sspe_Gene.69573::Locus_41011_Transcript_2_2_Confidence_0.500_Length_2101::g.69573::m.69573
MVFTVLVAGEVLGQTHNFEYSFSTHPTLNELSQQVESIFTAELGKNNQLGGDTTFAVQRMQVYDDRLQRWVELTSGRQLQDGCQVYVYSRSEFASIASPTKGTTAVTAVGAKQAAKPPPSQPPPLAPESVPIEDKVRDIFDVIDIRKTRRVSPLEFRAGLDRLRISFTPAATDELFKKADSNGDGVVSFAEWCKFAQLYPKLIDSCYHRLRACAMEDDQKALVAEMKEKLGALKASAEEAKHLVAKAQASVMEQEVILADSEAAVITAENDETSTSEAHKTCLQAVECAKDSVRDHAADRTHAKEREMDVTASLSESQFAVEECSRKVAAQDGVVAKCRERTRELERMLELARRDLGKAEATASQCRADLASAQEKESNARNEVAVAHQAVQDAHDLFVRAESNLSKVQESARAAAAANREAAHNTGLAVQHRDAVKREVLALKDRFVLAQKEEGELEAQVREQEMELERQFVKLDELVATIVRRAEEERPLLEEEMRLRLQRDTLEEREARLGKAHVKFKANLNRSSPQREPLGWDLSTRSEGHPAESITPPLPRPTLNAGGAMPPLRPASVDPTEFRSSRSGSRVGIDRLSFPSPSHKPHTVAASPFHFQSTRSNTVESYDSAVPADPSDPVGVVRSLNRAINSAAMNLAHSQYDLPRRR